MSSSSYLPATPLENLTVSEAYSAIRNSYAIFSPVHMYNTDTDMALSIIDRVEASIERELGDLTIKQVLEMNAEQSENLKMTMAES